MGRNKLPFIFKITIGRSFDAYDCLAYNGDWCEWCGEDNGGCLFCYNCGKRKTDREENFDINDLFGSLINSK